MAVPLIRVLVGLVGAVGGFATGFVARQPHINRLRAQVATLQKEIERLQVLLEEQDRQIQEMRRRYQALKAWQFTEKAKQGLQTRGAVIQQWALYEYIHLLYIQAQEVAVSDREKAFFDTYERLLGSGEYQVEDLISVKSYIEEKYQDEVRALQTPSPSQFTAALRGEGVA